MTATVVDQDEKAEALQRVVADPAVTVADLSLVMGVHASTIQRAIARGDFPYPVCRIGQRYIIPTAPIREALCLNQVGAA
jgi:hypothetical protein